MKANELRIGNLIYIVNKIEEVNHLYKYGRNDYPEVNGIIFKEGCCIKPIPLTEEWLVKFGLIKKYQENELEEGGFTLKEDGSRWYWWCDGGTFNLEIQENGEIWYEIYSHYRHIEYVHQLQNLYFALCGEELQLKQ